MYKYSLYIIDICCSLNSTKFYKISKRKICIFIWILSCMCIKWNYKNCKKLQQINMNFDVVISIIVSFLFAVFMFVIIFATFFIITLIFVLIFIFILFFLTCVCNSISWHTFFLSLRHFNIVIVFILFTFYFSDSWSMRARGLKILILLFSTITPFDTISSTM